MVDSQDQSKSPFILLAVLSVLVIATLVVASVYFLRPTLEMQLEQNISQKLEKAGVENTQVYVSGRDGVLTGEVESEVVAEKAEQIAKDTCGIRFIDNQLLVRNSLVKNQAIE